MSNREGPTRDDEWAEKGAPPKETPRGAEQRPPKAPSANEQTPAAMTQTAAMTKRRGRRRPRASYAGGSASSATNGQRASPLVLTD
jgi:hypothetical protein